jgi:hypothetical protein
MPLSFPSRLIRIAAADAPINTAKMGSTTFEMIYVGAGISKGIECLSMLVVAKFVWVTNPSSEHFHFPWPSQGFAEGAEVTFCTYYQSSRAANQRLIAVGAKPSATSQG